jgi:lipopolysaccharide/colanic/teichoic acid biosynthesis glycosyltransferase
MKKINIILSILVLVFLAGSLFVSKPALAITFFENPLVKYEGLQNHNLPKAQQELAQPVLDMGSAPEPTTFVLFLAGIVGFIARFVRNSFSKFKRYMDILLATFGILISGPILVFSAILIKLTSKGKVLYKQNRVGEKGRVFQIYKLRTMHINAEQGIGPVWAKKNDPRITRVGKVLRKTHLDEIPQLMNVLRGEMSIVGPRPERPEMVRDFRSLILDYEKRLMVKPGITGLAQTWHKYDETLKDVKNKIKYDNLYIKNMSLSTDLKILAKTLAVVVTGK